MHDERQSPPDVETWLRLAASQMPAMIWTTDRKLRFTSLGGSGWAGGEVEPEELIGLSLEEFFQTNDPQFPPLNAHHRALEGERVPHEVSLGGTDFWGVVEPLRDASHRIIGCVGMAIDITPQKQVERQIRAENERFHELIGNLPAALFQIRGADLDSTLDVPYVSDRFAELTGVSPQELQADPLLLFEIIHPDDRPLYYEKAWESMQQRTPFRIDMRCVTPTGETRWLRVSSRPTVLEDGRLLYHGLAIDIGDLKEAESVLRKAKDELGRFGHERIRDLYAVNAQLTAEMAERNRMEESLRAEQQFLRRLLDLQEQERKLLAYDIHDGFVQDVVGAKMILEAAMIKPESERLQKEINSARRYLGRAIDEGRRLIGELRPLIIDEEGIVAAIDYLVEDERQKNGITFSFTHDVQFRRLTPLVEGTLYRIVQEAVNNIKRHSKALSAEIRLLQRGDQLLLEIQDDGIGFDTARVPPNRFGLEGIRERARLFGGKATIRSARGSSTTVSVELPLNCADVTPEPSRPVSAPSEEEE